MPAELDYNWILPGKLAQGARPKPVYPAFGPFDVVVFTAMEYQPRVGALPRSKEAVYLPMDDDPYRPIPPAIIQAVEVMSVKLARAIQSGRRVLVTCQMGANRSGLVTGMTLRALGYKGPDAVALIRAKRVLQDGEKALYNPIFAKFVGR